MSTRDDKSLIGKKITATIGHPWQFVSSDGECILYGEVIDVLHIEKTDHPKDVVICEVTPFEHFGTLANHVVCCYRYLDGCDVIRALENGERVIFDLVYTVTQKDLNAEKIAELLNTGHYEKLTGGVTMGTFTHQQLRGRKTNP